LADRFNLGRFVDAQAAVYPQVLEELRGAAKRSHWMWFIFPQLAGLGSSPMAQAYALSGVEEARAYLAHGLLGARLRECTAILNALGAVPVEQIFGYPDDLKLHASLTLFAHAAAAAEAAPFRAALLKYFAGAPDPRTRELLTSACGTSG
jgi:uncharacterized protein (DUF1810 family)